MVSHPSDDDVAGPAADALARERVLVERARTEPAAMAELYRTYVDRVHSYAWKRTGSTEAAEDICSATFEAVVKGIGRFKWQAGGFAPWLFAIAANQVVAHHRKEARGNSERGQRAMSQMYEPVSHDDVTRIVEGDGDPQLRAALARLTPRYQRAIDLRYLADLSPEDAARAAGQPRAAFAVVLSRALKALRRELDRLEQEHP